MNLDAVPNIITEGARNLVVGPILFSHTFRHRIVTGSRIKDQKHLFIFSPLI